MEDECEDRLEAREEGGRVAYGAEEGGKWGGTRWGRLAIWWYIRKSMGGREVEVK